MALNNKSKTKKQEKTSEAAIWKMVNKLSVNDLENVTNISYLRMGNYLCVGCRSRYKYPFIKLSIIKQGDKSESDLCFCSVACAVHWLRNNESVERLAADMGSYKFELNDEENGEQ